MNDFGPKRPMSESAETAPTDTAKAKRGRPKKKPDYDRENVRKKACTRLTCSRICDILESWETVALAALIIANLYTVSSRQQSKDRLRCEEEYNGLKYMKNIDKRKLIITLYYLGLMSRISAIKDIAAVEDVLLEREPIFQRYELELWRRIAIVLTDRGDIRRLYNSGLKYIRFLKEISEKVTIRDEAVDAIEAYCVGLHNAEAVDEYGAFLKKCGELTQLLADNKRIAVICCQNYGRLMHLRLYKNVNAEIQEEWNAIVEILKQCNYDEDVYKNVLDAVEEYFRTLVQRKKEDKLFELERFMAQVYEENGRCEAAEVAALCLANLYNSGGHRKITPDEYETIKKYLQKFPESMHIRAAFIIASEAIYSPSAEYKRVPDKIINKAKQWSEQYPKKIEFQEAYFGLLFSRLKYAQAQDMRNEQRRVYREMKTVAERANYSEYNESNQLMESVDILHRVFGY